jgi:hypothetical protein
MWKQMETAAETKDKTLKHLEENVKKLMNQIKEETIFLQQIKEEKMFLDQSHGKRLFGGVF